MQTFLPYRSFTQTARCLDYRRLGKQRVEAMQILNALKDTDYGWQNHPAVSMWKPYQAALEQYHDAMIYEWIARGYKNNMKLFGTTFAVKPHWLSRRFCIAHRSNLLRKDFDFYSRYDWNVPDDLPYIWPEGAIR